MRLNYKSELTDEDCRVIVDHLLTKKHRELVTSDLINYYKTVTSRTNAWHAGHYKFKVRIEKGLSGRPNTRVEKIWQPGKFHNEKNRGF